MTYMMTVIGFTGNFYDDSCRYYVWFSTILVQMNDDL